jgi:hypothetical protein
VRKCRGGHGGQELVLLFGSHSGAIRLVGTLGRRLMLALVLLTSVLGGECGLSLGGTAGSASTGRSGRGIIGAGFGESRGKSSGLFSPLLGGLRQIMPHRFPFSGKLNLEEIS